MKITRQTRLTVATIVVLAGIVGTIAWEILERLLQSAGIAADLSVGPVGFDVYAVSFFVRANPGTIAGLAAGLVIVRVL